MKRASFISALLLLIVFLISQAYGAEQLANAIANRNTPNKQDEFLHIHAIAHSHCDPGWWYTFEEYYDKWVHGILDAVYTCLSSNQNRTFIWAEISFFERWWRDQYPEVHEKMREFINVGRIEFVTGGWVMHDEGVSHYTDQLLQLQLGHQWLQRTFQRIPSYAWLIDPFGHSSTTPLLYARAGFKGTVLNRIHYRLREELKLSKMFEFHWKPQWSHSDGHAEHSTSTGLDSTDMFCHLLPNGYYDVPNTCGPDPNVCIQFEWEHTKGIPVTSENLARQATLLADQYRKSAEWFRSPHIMILIGDDFKYKTPEKGEKLLSQWEMLYDYINSHPEKYNMRIEWSTLSRYFGKLAEWEADVRSGRVADAEPALTNISMPPHWSVPEDPKAVFPEFSGDFLSYSDRVEQYWSGYYTSRPHLKSLIRSAAAALRALELTASTTLLLAPPISTEEGKTKNENTLSFDKELFTRVNKGIEGCMREISLLQHHDAVTGTARTMVVADYAERLRSCIRQSSNLLLEMFNTQLKPIVLCGEAEHTVKPSLLNVFCSQKNISWSILQTHLLPPHGGTEEWAKSLSLPTDSKFSLVLLLNTLGQSRKEIFSFLSASPAVRFHDLATGVEFQVQVQPLLANQRTSPQHLILQDHWQHLIQTEVPAAGWTVLMVEQEAEAVSHRNFAKLTLVGRHAADAQRYLSGPSSVYPADKITIVDSKSQKEDLSLRLNDMELHFDATLGLLKAVKWSEKDSSARSLRQSLLHYRSSGSGAYIFDPTGPATVMGGATEGILVVEGSLQAAVHTLLPPPFQWQTISLTRNEKHLDHITQICLNHQYGSDEFGIRYSTDLLSHNETLWTDINGWPTVSHPRVRYTDPQTGKINTNIAMASNFHPMIAFAALEDREKEERFSILSRSSSAVATLKDGDVEVMIDRQTHNDDGRGLGEPLMDSTCFERALRLTLSSVEEAQKNTPTLSLRHQFPVTVALSNALEKAFVPPSPPKLPHGSFSLFQLNSPLPPNLHLLSLRPCLSEPSQVCLQLQHLSSHSDTAEENINIGSLLTSQVNQKLRCVETDWEALPREKALGLPLSSCVVSALEPLDIVQLQLVTPGALTLLNESIITWTQKTHAPPPTSSSQSKPPSQVPEQTTTQPASPQETETQEIKKEEEANAEVVPPEDEVKVAEEEPVVENEAEEAGAPASQFISDAYLETVPSPVLPSVYWLVLQALVVFIALAALAVFVVHPRLLPRLIWHSSRANGQMRTENRIDRIV